MSVTAKMAAGGGIYHQDPFNDYTYYLFQFDGNLTNSGKYGTSATNGGGTVGLTTGTAPTYSTTIKKTGTHSAIFNGTSTRPQMNDSVPWMANNDFTVEAWVYPTANDVNRTIISTVCNATQGWSLWLNAGGSGITFWMNNVTYLNPTTSIPLNDWTHVAVTRQGTTLRAFINGVLVQTATCSDFTQSYNPANPYVGYDSQRGYFAGHMDALRWTYACRYTQDFSPPTSLPSFQVLNGQTMPDPHINNVSLLLHCEGTTGSTAVPTDSSPRPKTLTRNGSSSTRMVHNTTIRRFGSSSIALGGSAYNGASAQATYTIPTHTDFDFGTGDFTIELWYCRYNGGGGYLFGNGTTTTGLTLNANQGPAPNVGFTASWNNAGIVSNFAPVFVNTNWHHVILSRVSGTLWLGADGYARSVSFTDAVNLSGYIWGARTTSDTLWIGGFMDELRITKGVGRISTTYYEVPNYIFPDN